MAGVAFAVFACGTGFRAVLLGLLAEGVSNEPMTMGEQFLNGGIDNKPRCLVITDVGEQCRNPAVTKVRSGRKNYAVCRLHEHVKKESKVRLNFVAL